MQATSEQPDYLKAVSYRRLVHVFRPILLINSVLLSGLVLVALWRRAEAGQQIWVWFWVIGACIGPLTYLLVRFGLRSELQNRCFLEFPNNGLFLTRRGGIAYARLVA